jgi:alginate O-acetyltransferase complex protein AlgI
LLSPSIFVNKGKIINLQFYFFEEYYLIFVVWGLLHGIYQISGNVLKPVRKKIIRIFNIKTSTFSYRLNQVLFNFILVDFAWIFFRSTSLRSALVLIKNMTYLNPWIFTDGSLYKLGLDPLDFLIAILSLGVVLIVNLLQRNKNLRYELSKQNIVFRWSVYLTSILIILIFGMYGSGYNPQQFIYSKF